MVGTAPHDTKDVKATWDGRMVQRRMLASCITKDEGQKLFKPMIMVEEAHHSDKDNRIDRLTLGVDLADPRRAGKNSCDTSCRLESLKIGTFVRRGRSHHL
jgi:hypothetical protein